MRNSMKAGVSALALALSVSAQAPAHAEGGDLSGFYIGIHAGVGNVFLDGGRELTSPGPPDPGEFADDLDLSSLVGGLHAGFNYPLIPLSDDHTLIIGLEGGITLLQGKDDIDTFDGSDFEGISADTDLLTTIRGRLGVQCDTGMLYLTGGLAFPKASFEWYENNELYRIKFNDIGGVIGGGAELFVPNFPNALVRLEGLYYFFGEKHSLNGLGGADPGDYAKLDDAFVVRIGLSILLNTLLDGS